jgi:hypothetical protein
LVVTLQHAQADELVPLINDILNDTYCTRPAHPWACVGVGVEPDPRPHVLCATAAGRRLILDGTPDMLADAKELISRLDVAPDPQPTVRWLVNGGCGRPEPVVTSPAR